MAKKIVKKGVWRLTKDQTQELADMVHDIIGNDEVFVASQSTLGEVRMCEDAMIDAIVKMLKIKFPEVDDGDKERKKIRKISDAAEKRMSKNVVYTFGEREAYHFGYKYAIAVGAQRWRKELELRIRMAEIEKKWF